MENKDLSSAQSANANHEHELSFEDAYKQLQDLVKKMEQGALPLADSVTAYEQAMKLKNYCGQLLKQAETKIETLAQNGN
jgi:exodeoxyribonuclease VII small subunit